MKEHSGRFVNLNGYAYLYCSGTNYLNLAYEEPFKMYAQKGMQKYGVGYGSSPNSKPQLAVFDQLAIAIAEFYQAEAACLFSSGFLACQAIIQSKIDDGYCINYHANTHPALRIKHSREGKAIFAGDLINPIQLHELSNRVFQNEHGSIIDASHGFGIHDEKICEILQMENTIVCGSLNKAFSIPAGVVLCTNETKEKLSRQPAYATSSAPNPALCYALHKAFTSGLIIEQQERLHSLLIQIPESEHYKFLPPYPILKLADAGNALYNLFYKENIVIWRNKYPKASGDYYNRIILHAGLQESDLELMLSLLHS